MKKALQKIKGLFSPSTGDPNDQARPLRGELFLEQISDINPEEHEGEVIFVHGIGGDHYETWVVSEGDEKVHWAKWLAELRPSLRFWTLGYPASPSLWDGSSMPLQDLAVNLLALLKANDLGKKPICFITHSMGGLLVKQMLRTGISGSMVEFSQIGRSVRGICFISTPNTGSDLPTLVNYLVRILGTSPAIEDLRDNGALLRDLNIWYINQVEHWGIMNKVFFETIPTFGQTVVDESSAALFVKGVNPIPVQADHIEISRPLNRESLVYQETRDFVDKVIPPSERENRAESLRILKLPLSRNQFFTGREELLNRLHASYNNGELVQALGGPGGIGKTQAAVEYVHRYRREYRYLFWVKAHSRVELFTGFADIAVLLNLNRKDAEDQSLAVGEVKNWLESNEGWLLILDNADDLAVAREFIPSSETGHILLTTRANYTGKIAVRYHIKKMEPEEGALFLLRRLGKLKIDEPLEFAPLAFRVQAEALSRILDGLPLALEQAAAFIKETPATLGDYLNLYQAEHSGLQLVLSNLEGAQQESLAVTCTLAFEKIEEVNPAAADLLRLCSFLEADAIPEEIFSGGKKEFGDELGAEVASSGSLLGVINEAGRFSLLHHDPETRTVSLHRSVQAILRETLESETRRRWAETAVRTLSRVFPEVEFANWQLCGRLVQHAQSVASLIDEYSFDFPEASRLLIQAGMYLYERAQYTEAEPLYQRAITIKEKTMGREHPSAAATLNNLAELYRAQGRYEDSEPIYRRSLMINEKALGGEHPSVAATLNNLAELYRAQCKYEDAEPLYIRSLAIKGKALGPEHPSVAATLNNLAELYRAQGKYEDAEPLYKRSLAIKGKALGPHHPFVATTLGSLAELYRAQSKYEEAEPLYKQALVIYEKAMGQEHPDMAITLNNLALLYEAMGKYEEAEQLYKRSLATNEKALGPHHPFVSTTLGTLAELYRAQGKYEEAEPLYRRSLATREKTLGPEHPFVATVLGNLADLYRVQAKYAEAEPLYRRSLAINEKALGSVHLSVANTLGTLAELYRALGRDEEAEPLYKRSLVITEKTLGADHPDVATTLNNLAELYRAQGRYNEAEPLYKRSLVIKKKALGPDHPDVATVLENFASLLRKIDKFSEAEELESRASIVRAKYSE